MAAIVLGFWCVMGSLCTVRFCTPFAWFLHSRRTARAARELRRIVDVAQDAGRTNKGALAAARCARLGGGRALTKGIRIVDVPQFVEKSDDV